MVMHADYTDKNLDTGFIHCIDTIKLEADSVICLGGSSSWDNILHQFVFDKTSRESILTFIPDNSSGFIEKYSIDALCKKIGLAEKRVGAILVGMESNSPLFFKKVREIASAEGALLILQASRLGNIADVIRYSSPDAMILEYENCFWLALNVLPNGGLVKRKNRQLNEKYRNII